MAEVVYEGFGLLACCARFACETEEQARFYGMSGIVENLWPVTVELRPSYLVADMPLLDVAQSKRRLGIRKSCDEAEPACDVFSSYPNSRSLAGSVSCSCYGHCGDSLTPQ